MMYINNLYYYVIVIVIVTVAIVTVAAVGHMSYSITFTVILARVT